MPPLESALRSLLKSAVEEARDVAQAAALEALKTLGVDQADAMAHLSESQKALRRRLRAHGRALGDTQNADKVQELTSLTDEVAYEHWHRMLFARFLAENDLLVHPEHQVPVSLDELKELAQENAQSPWKLAGQWASRLLPQIFRTDNPVLELPLHPARQNELEEILTRLPTAVFQASDALGWVYQYWQTKTKADIEASGVKVGAKELPAATQLFTEPYMVSFLLDNSLGAWWAKQILTESDLKDAATEDELRNKVAREGIPLEYLRFVASPSEGWEIAGGSFEAWPQNLADFRMLDPCCGSGHFLVAVFNQLVPLRMEREGLSARDACEAVLRQNIHGLELDARCVELAVFALALAAWTYPESGGYRELPAIQLACVGRAPSASKQDWLKRAKNDRSVKSALDMLYDEFRQAPSLGSLMNPAKTFADKALLAEWKTLEAVVLSALAQEDDSPEEHEMGLAAQGLAKATTLLTGKYHWVITNVPYKAKGKLAPKIAAFCEANHPEAKAELATVFLERCLDFCAVGGNACVVLPQNWLFLGSYKKFREKLLRNERWNLIARLGPKGFSTPMWDFNVQLISLTRQAPSITGGIFGESSSGQQIRGLDVSNCGSPVSKASELVSGTIQSVVQAKQLENPDSRVAFDGDSTGPLLANNAYSHEGLTTGDLDRFVRSHWELQTLDNWVHYIQNTASTTHYSGRTDIIHWGKNGEIIEAFPGSFIKGKNAWGSVGLRITQMNSLPITMYSGEVFGKNAATVVPNDINHLPAIWCYCSSPEYNEAVRRIDQKLNVTNATLVKVPFDLEHWSTVAAEKYPHGLPQPYSDDPTQWIFHGHPCGSVIWDESTKRTAQGPLRLDASVLQVAVARLLGYSWPAELDVAMELAPEQRAWVERAQALNSFVDDDGIVCLSAVRGEAAAADRLRALLTAAYGGEFSETHLLQAAGTRSNRLEDWLRDEFFEAHCKMFQQRPFVWHIWDGLKDGFSVLVNYHTFDRAHLESLIYTYLREWIERQAEAEALGDAGGANRRAAAEGLKAKLEKILEGENPHDIFVRWKPLAAQPMGWEPDLNDGVRMNIRPFLTVGDVGRTGAGILRWKPNIKWDKDRGKDVESAPWFATFNGDRINDHHTSLTEKRQTRGLT